MNRAILSVSFAAAGPGWLAARLPNGRSVKKAHGCAKTGYSIASRKMAVNQAAALRLEAQKQEYFLKAVNERKNGMFPEEPIRFQPDL
jgi:hypothetical protein